MPASLANRRYLIVGATGDIGRAITGMLAGRGASVLVSGRDESQLASLSTQNGIVETIAADVSTPAGLNRIVAMAGELDGLVYAAGIAPVGPLRYLRAEVLRECGVVNFEAPLLITRDLLKAKKLRREASIIFVSSVSATVSKAGYCAYSGSKAALEAASRCLARELSSKKIRVNCVAPGMVRSEMADEAENHLSAEAMLAHSKQYPLGEGVPLDVAGAISFLLSDDARWVTGTTLTVDGGFSA